MLITFFFYIPVRYCVGIVTETPAVPVIVTGNVPVPVLYLSISNVVNLCSTGTYISFSFVQEEASVYVYLVWLLSDYAFATVGLKCVNNELFV